MSLATIKKSSARESLATIESYLEEVGKTTKTAAEANTEAGSQGGETTHPVKNVDDNTDPAKEGARSAENTADVKEEQGKPSVDSTPEAKAKAAAEEGAGASGSAASDQLQIGTKKAPTGEDPKVETESVKPGKEDPGTTHPAKTDNDSLNGGKYAADLDGASFEKLASIMQELGNDICAMIAIEGDTKTAAAPVPPKKEEKPAPTPPPAKQAEAIDPKLSEQVSGDASADKQAADAMVVSVLSEIIKSAEADGDRVISYLTAYHAPKPQTKQAEGFPPGAGGGGPPMGGGAGGPEPDADNAGGPGDGDSDDAGGGMSEEDLVALAQQLGVSPEELIQILEQEAAGGGGGGAPGGAPGGAEAGGPPPMPAGGGGGGGAAMPPPGMQVQAADEGVTKEKVAAYIREIVGRSRAKKAAAK